MLAAARRAVELETDGQSPSVRHRPRGARPCRSTCWASWTRRSSPLRAASRSDGAPGMVRVLALSLESFVESERGDLVRARECAELAMDVVDSPRTARLATGVPGLHGAGAGAGRRRARSTMRWRPSSWVWRSRRRRSAQGVWGPIHHLMVTARVAAQPGRAAMARELLAELAPPAWAASPTAWR